MVKHRQATESDLDLVVKPPARESRLKPVLDYFDTLKSGDQQVLEFEEGDDPKTIKRNYSRAAAMKGLYLAWENLSNGDALFTVKPIQEKPGYGRLTVPQVSATGDGRRRGRPPKAETAG
jgi:uncharacterized protein (DUF2249 family)